MPHCFPWWLHQFITTQIVLWFPFLHILSKPWYLLPLKKKLLGYSWLTDLHCCVNFRCLAKWITCTYIRSFSDSFPIQVAAQHWVNFPVYIEDPCYLPSPYRVVCLCQPNLPIYPHLSVSPVVTISLLWKSLTLSLLCKFFCYLFDDRHSDKREVMSHCGFDLHFPDD